jgi:hypothetical protein
MPISQAVSWSGKLCSCVVATLGVRVGFLRTLGCCVPCLQAAAASRHHSLHIHAIRVCVGAHAPAKLGTSSSAPVGNHLATDLVPSAGSSSNECQRRCVAQPPLTQPAGTCMPPHRHDFQQESQSCIAEAADVVLRRSICRLAPKASATLQQQTVSSASSQ